MKTAIDSENKLKILSKKNQYEITRANELRKISEDMIVIKKIIYSTQTIPCLKDDIRYIKISKERFEKKLLQQRDESIELNVKMKSETELGMKQKILSIENQDEVLRLDELRELLKARAGEKKSTILWLEEDITARQPSKEDSKKKLLAQRDKTGELTVTLKTDIDSSNNLKILLIENQDEITRLNESGFRSKDIEGEK